MQQRQHHALRFLFFSQSFLAAYLADLLFAGWRSLDHIETEDKNGGPASPRRARDCESHIKST
jgi:hypothetical protein